MNKYILIILSIICLILILSGFDSSTPSHPKKPGNLVTFKCINGYVYVALGHGLANYIENGKFKECK